jgi:hypothetical protein
MEPDEGSWAVEGLGQAPTLALASLADSGDVDDRLFSDLQARPAAPPPRALFPLAMVLPDFRVTMILYWHLLGPVGPGRGSAPFRAQPMVRGCRVSFLLLDELRSPHSALDQG